MFAGIKGSMDLMEDLDPEDARAIVSAGGARRVDLRYCRKRTSRAEHSRSEIPPVLEDE